METPCTEQRLARLERQNRRLRLGLLAVILIAGGGLWLSAVRGVRAQAPAWKRTVEAEKFVLRDASGRTLAALGLLPGGPGLALYGTNEKMRAVLFVSPVGPALDLSDSRGNVSADLAVSEDTPSLDLFEGTLNPRDELTIVKGAPVLAFYDTSGQVRAALDGATDGPSLSLEDSAGFESVIGHAVLTTPSTGSQSQSSAASIHLFNNAGNVIWAAP